MTQQKPPDTKPRAKKPPKTHEEILKALQDECRSCIIASSLCLLPYYTRPLPPAERTTWRVENGVEIAAFQFLPEEEPLLQEAGIPFRRYEFRLCPETIEEGMSTYRRNRLRQTFIWTAIKEIKAALAEIEVAVKFLTSAKGQST